MRRVRVLVADDSVTVRARIVAALERAPDMEVVGEAADGREAIELCLARRPDVITLDMMMPAMTGLQATEYIMAYAPTPIVIVSASTNRGELFRTYDALAAGAIDVIEKPRPNESPEAWDEMLAATVRMASRIRVITHPKGRLRRLSAMPGEPGAAAVDGAALLPWTDRVVAIGASTGGPAAVVELLGALPADYPHAILLVLHLSAVFASAFAEWLGRESPVPVQAARDGQPLPPSGVVLAPADRHMVVDGPRIKLTDDPPRHSCRPSVDVLFASVAREIGARAVGVLLTGMGKDGAEGLLAMRQAGATTIAQDQASSAVYGMPREAVAIGAAEYILPPRDAGMFLRRLAAVRSARDER
jgi:two-component system, chemotaxis family, protein-glutamate methylesterase/glutaminase